MGGNHDRYADEQTGTANGKWLHPALRETRAFIARPRFWALLGTGIAISALAGPFHTMALLTLPGRVLYWGASIGLATLLLTFFSFLARAMNAEGRVHWVLATLAATLVAVPPVYTLIWTMDTLLDPAGETTGALLLLLYVAAPMVSINLIVNSTLVVRDREAVPQGAPAAAPAGDRLEPAPRPAPETQPSPLLFEKLPPTMGRELICLRAQDHYLEAVTPQGRATVLMRLSDAERDLTGFAGMRVHRSWWVNLDHVTGFMRTEAGGMDLTTTNGLVIPVARGQRAALRAAMDQRREAGAVAIPAGPETPRP